MKLTDVPTPELRRILRATEKAEGPESVEARIFRRELDRRKQERPRRRKGKGGRP